MFLSNVEDGTKIFIDANIFVYHFTANSRFNPSCTSFLESIEKGNIQGFTTVSVIQEGVHRIMIEEAALLLPDVKAKDIVKYLKTHHDVVKSLAINREVPSKIVRFNVEIIPADIRIIEKSQLIKIQYGFLSNDALTLQVMKDFNISHLASNDSDFERVDFITLYKPIQK